MDKKIKSVEELLKKYEENKKIIEIRQKWTDEELKRMICLKIGVNSKNEKNLENSERVIQEIINYLEIKAIENIAVIKTEFAGYEGENPSLEVVIPNQGQVVFGNVSSSQVIEILNRYLIENDEILRFLEKNRCE